MKFSAPSKKPRAQIVKAASLPAPTSGLNSRDPLAVMEMVYAIQLTNFVCTPSGVAVREGYREWASGMPGIVRSLMAYNTLATVNSKMFAYSSGNIYDITSAGVVGTPAVTGLDGTFLEHTNFLSAGGQYLIVCNGTDAVHHFDGSNWVAWTNVAPAAPSTPGQISGVNPALLRGVISHQRRLWFIEEGSTKAWYFPVNSVGGQAVQFDFGPLFPRGGRLKALGTWSIDGGTGMQNQLVAVSEFGDIVIYEGTDPSSSTTWRIAGVWQAGAPINNRCLMDYGSDLLYLSQDGLIPLGTYLKVEQSKVAITDVIRPTISMLVATQGGLQGWQLHSVYAKNLIIINVPQANPANNLQLVLNTVTGGWTLWEGVEAQQWLTFGTNNYFAGTNGKVWLAFRGYQDKTDSNGANGQSYIASCQQAFSYFEDRARNKRCVMARMNVLSASENPRLMIGVNTDFNVQYYDTITQGAPTGSAIWNTSLWDQATWSGGLNNFTAWQTVSGVGYCVSPTVTLSVNSETIWVSTDIVYENGGVIG